MGATGCAKKNPDSGGSSASVSGVLERASVCKAAAGTGTKTDSSLPGVEAVEEGRRWNELLDGRAISGPGTTFQVSLRSVRKEGVSQIHEWNKTHDDPVYYPMLLCFARYKDGTTAILYHCHDICSAVSEADHMLDVVLNARIFIRDLVINYGGDVGYGPFDWPQDPNHWLKTKDEHDCLLARDEPKVAGIKNVFLFVPLNKRKLLKSEKVKVNMSCTKNIDPEVAAYVNSLSKEEYWTQVNSRLCNVPPPPYPDPVMDYMLSSKSRVFQIEFFPKRGNDWTIFKMKTNPSLLHGYKPAEYPMARPEDIAADACPTPLDDLPGTSFMKTAREERLRREALNCTPAPTCAPNSPTVDSEHADPEEDLNSATRHGGPGAAGEWSVSDK